MHDWITKLNDFLKINEQDILTHAGSISHEVAAAKAEAEYEVFYQKQISEQSAVEKQFEEAVEKIKKFKTTPKEKKQKKK